MTVDERLNQLIRVDNALIKGDHDLIKGNESGYEMTIVDKSRCKIVDQSG